MPIANAPVKDAVARDVVQPLLQLRPAVAARVRLSKPIAVHPALQQLQAVVPVAMLRVPAAQQVIVSATNVVATALAAPKHQPKSAAAMERSAANKSLQIL